MRCKKKLHAILITLLFLASLLPMLEITSASTITTVDSSVATQYGNPYNQRKMVRLNDSSMSLGCVYQDATSTLAIYWAKSSDNGTTWGSPVKIFQSTWINQYSTAAVAVGKNNTIHVVYGWRDFATNIYYISYNFSTNNGTTWSPGRVIANGGTGYSQNDPMVAVDSLDNIHVVWGGVIASGGWNIRYMRFTKATGTWSAITNLTAVNWGQYYPSIAIDGSNNLHIAWEAYRPGISGLQIRYRKYTNATSIWETVVNVTAESGQDQQKVQMVVNSTNGIHLVWYGVMASGPTGNRVVRHKSVSSGGIWSAMHNVSTDSPSMHCYTPTITIEQNNKMHVIYYMSITHRDIYYSSSTDGGSTWSAPTAILSNTAENRYQSSLWSYYPYNGNRTNRPKTGYCFIWTEQTTPYAIKYFASDDLTWETKTPPAGPPAGPPDYRPTIEFAADTTTNGTDLYNDWINVNITSTDGSYNNNYLYVGTGEPLGPDIFRYDNSTWITSYNGTGAKYIIDITEYNGALYAAFNGYNPGDGDIYRSTDGSTWTVSYNGTTEIGYYSLCEYNGLLYAGGVGYVKVFDGTTWTTSTSSSLYYTSMHTFGGNLYVGTYNPGSVSDANIWKYNGAVWTKVFDAGSYFNQYDWCYALEEYNGALWAGMGSIASNSADIFNSTDGTTWTISLNATTGHSIWDLKAFKGNLFASQGLTATEGDIWRFNGTAWIKSWDLGTYTRLFALGVYAGKLWTGTYPYARIFSSTDGSTWNLEKTLSSGTQEIQCFYATNVSHHYTFLDFDQDLLQWSLMDYYSGATLNDNSTWNNDGTITGGAIQDTNGVYGDCFSFDGDGDYISIPTSASLNSIDETATISLWAKSDQDYASFPNNGRGFFSFQISSTHRIWAGITKNTPGTCSNTVSIYDRLGTNYYYKSVSNALPTDYIRQWHHYVFIFTATNVTCYIDGAYAGMAAFTTEWANLSYLQDGFTTTIGRGSWTSGTWDWYGDIDDFLISNRAFNITEIRSLNDAMTTQYEHNFTDLANGNYTFQGSAVNSFGLVNQTETRWSNLNMQYPPIVTIIDPTNGSTNQDLFTTCSVTVYDQNGDTVNITWQTNSSGSWLTKHVDHNVASGSIENWQFVTFSQLNRKYYWRVYIDDGLFNVSYIYHLTTTGMYFAIDGLNNYAIDWSGIAGSAYWCNSTGPSSETMKITMSVGPADEVTKAGIWLGDLSVVHTDDFTTGWNNNTQVPEWAIDTCQWDDPETVFESVHENLIRINEQGTGLWWARTGTPTLLHILPDQLYNIQVNASCQLYIVSDVQVNASNVSVQFSGDNLTWGSITRLFGNGGSEIFVNNTLWLNSNGCYGINPFGSPISGVTAYMWLRFKLNLPMGLPSNYSYFSLSANNWKINFYEGDTGETFLPLNLPATLPTSGHFSTKWVNTTIGYSGYAEAVADDVNNDGYMEIFWSGVDSETSPTFQDFVCYNPLTGKAIWKVRQTTPTSYLDIHVPIVIYDFDKDGTKEVIKCFGRNAIMYNAYTGAVEWSCLLHTDGYVQHHFAYLDKGDEVYIYFATGDTSAPYDARIDKVRGSNGTIVASSPQFYYSCYGGTSIGDLDGDGKYEIVVTDRGQDKYPGTPAKGLRVYDEDLNMLWYATGWNGAAWVPGWPTTSSHCAKLIDLNGDGKLEVIVGKQAGAGVDWMGLYIYNWDGSIYRYQEPLAGMRSHITSTIADVDGDGHYEYLDGYDSLPKVFDLTDWVIEATLPVSVSEPPDIGNVILDPGESDTRSEIMIGTTGTPVYKYNTTTHTYQFIANMGQHSMFQVVADFDWDGYNEVLLPSTKRLSMIETRVPALQPGPRVNIGFDGERRLNNGEYYSRPYAGEGLIASLSFGGEASIPAISDDLFITNCNSSKDIIELNGYYNLGDYRTFVNSSIYCPSPWSVNTIYVNLINETGVVYDNITGFSFTGINATHMNYYKLYNPALPLDGNHSMDFRVYITINYLGIPVFSGNKTFNNTLEIYDIDPPYNWSSHYNVTLNSVNLSWDPGNFSDRYIVVRNVTGYPTTPSGGTVVQNATKTSYNESGVYTTRYYSVFSYNATTRSYSEAMQPAWGAMGINCYNESNPSQNLTFNLFITNEQGTQTYVATGCTNTKYLDFADIPTGERTVVQVTSTGYKVRYYYMDLLPNMLHSLNAYLPPDKITGGGGGSTEPTCVQRLYIDSKTVTSYTTDQTVNLSFDLDTLVDVQLFNRSLYGTYGGWYFIPADKYTTSTTQVIVNKTVLDDNTTILKVTYYYEDCTTVEGEPGLYLITVWDYYDQPIQAVKVEFKVYINTTDQYEPVSILYTDSMGQVNLYLIPFSIYKVVCSKDGFITSISDYIPDPNIRVHTFKLNAEEPSGTEYVDIYHNLSWTLEPKNRYQSGPFMVWFNITSADDQLEWYRMKIDRYNSSSLLWTNLYNGNTTDQAGGGTLSFLMPNTTGRYRVQTYFKKIGFPIYEIGYSEGGCDIFHISGGGGLADNPMIQAIPGWVYMAIVLIIAAFVMAFALPMAGIGTGFIGIGIIGFAMILKPDLIMDDGTTGWVILTITTLVYSLGVFVWSRI